MITRVLRNDLTVLILGESGTGKELVAEAIHQHGSRKAGPFVAVNMAAIPSELIESELFGHEKGAFTGAVAARRQVRTGEPWHLVPGRNRRHAARSADALVARAAIGAHPPCRGRAEVAMDVRVIAATNRDLAPMIAAGKFREDLYYRLNVFSLNLPPLRERPDDIAALTRHFLNLAAQEGLPRRRLSDEAIALLQRQPWRGNVRELRNFAYRAALLAREEEIDATTVSQLLADRPMSDENVPHASLPAALEDWLANTPAAPGTLYHAALAAFERPLFEHALSRTGGNQLRAAALLGINRNTLRKRLSELAIDPDSFSATN